MPAGTVNQNNICQDQNDQKGIDHMAPATCSTVCLKQFGRTFAQRCHVN